MASVPVTTARSLACVSNNYQLERPIKMQFSLTCLCADPANAAAAAPVQMSLLPSMTSCQPTATASANAAGSPAKPGNASDATGDASASAPGLQTPPKSGKRRRGGRV